MFAAQLKAEFGIVILSDLMNFNKPASDYLQTQTQNRIFTR